MSTKFENKIFDEAGFRAELNRLQKGKEILIQNISDLQAEGFAVDKKSIEKYIGMNDETWHDYIGGMLSEYLAKLGFVLREEKNRIAGLYQQLFERTVVLIRSIRAGINQYRFQLIDINGIVAINDEGTEDAIRDKYTSEIDGEALEEYYSLVLGVKDALESIKAFENKHGLTRSLTQEKYMYTGKAVKAALLNGVAIPPRETSLFRFIKDGCSQETFEDMVGNEFLIKK